MARRKRKEDEGEWVPPEFDEVGYMRKEIESAMVALVTIGWAAVGAAIAYAVYLWNPAIGFVAGLLAFGALYFLLPLLGLPIDAFRRRDWAGHASIYFFSWLAFFIIILNPPFGDHTPPAVQFVAAGTYPAVAGAYPTNLTCVAMTSGTTRVGGFYNGTTNSTLYVLFRATDNVGVARVAVTVNSVPTNATLVAGQQTPCYGAAKGTTHAPGTYAVRLIIPNFSVQVSVTAWDTSGLSSSASARVQVV